MFIGQHFKSTVHKSFCLTVYADRMVINTLLSTKYARHRVKIILLVSNYISKLKFEPVVNIYFSFARFYIGERISR